MTESPFVLLCAGEDSGDVLGEGFVAAVKECGLVALGAGGARMVQAGLVPLIDFEELPVSGFGDVFPRYFKLRKLFGVMKAALRSPNCAALVAIDYPGFNMGLTTLAKKLNKPVLYVAPPQVWAWKRSRAKKLQGVNLAVLFEFEKEVYEKCGCKVELLKHPFAVPKQNLSKLQLLDSERQPSSAKKDFLLLPGSRERQALRNLSLYLNVIKSGTLFGGQKPVKILAARKSLVAVFEKKLTKAFNGTVPKWISVQISPTVSKDRMQMFADASGALAAPGTATLELALSGCPLVVATLPDKLTYAIGKMFVRTDFFAMPNILLQQKAIPEFIIFTENCAGQILHAIENCKKNSAKEIAESLNRKLQGGQLPLELFRQLL